MQLRIALIALFLSINLITKAQWTLTADLGNNNVYGIKAYDSLFLYAGTSGYFLRSLDGGANWDSLPLLDPANVPYISTTLKSIYFVSNTTGFATGTVTLGNSEAILKTINGGLNWQVVSLLNVGALPRILNQISFFNTSLGFAVGTNGRILKTTDGGNTWNAQTSGISASLTDIQALSTTTIVAVGSNYLLQSTDGGTSWVSNFLAGVVFKAVHFPNSSIGYACGDDNAFYKTTNQGSSWTQISINLPGSNNNFKDIHFTSQDTGYAIVDSMVLKTCDGGLHWERFVCSAPMNNLYFLTNYQAYLCGDDGVVYSTFNAGIPYYPISLFDYSPLSLCCDSTIFLNNQSNPASSFTWMLNGVPISNSYNSSTIVNQGNQADTIKLVINNGFYTDTNSRVLNIKESLQFNINAASSNDTICAGGNVTFFVYNSLLGVSYSLYRGTTLLQTLNGTGSTLAFVTLVSSQDNYSIKATKTVAGCGSNTITYNKTIYTYNPLATLTINSSADTICKSATVNITIQGSELGVLYQLRNNGVNTGTPATGNGGTIILTTYSLTTSCTISVYATNITHNCSSNLTATKFISIESPKSYFSASTNYPEVGEQCSYSNSSINMNGGWTWYFQNSDTVTSNAINPSGITFNTSGISTIKLVNVSPKGCSDTLLKTVTVLDSAGTDTCWVTRIQSHYGTGLYTIHNDGNDNKYLLDHVKTKEIYKIYGHNNDSLIRNYYSGFTYYDQGMVLNKLNAKGEIQWHVLFNFKSTYVKNGGIKTDNEGNVYCYYYHGDFSDSLIIHSQNGKINSFFIDNIGNDYAAIVLKFDRFGDFKWMYKFHTLSTYADHFSIAIDSHSNLYLGTMTKLTKINSGGVFKWSIPGDYAHVACDSHDRLLTSSYYYGLVSMVDTIGVILNNYPSFQTTAGLAVKQFALDEHDNIYLGGVFGDTMVFAGQTFYAPHIGSQNFEDAFLAKMSSDGTQKWAQQIYSKYGMALKGMDVKRGNIIISGAAYAGDSVSLGSGNTIFFTKTGHCVYISDTLGVTILFKKIYESNPGTLNGALGVFKSAKWNNLNDGLTFSVEHNSPITFLGQNYGPIAGLGNYVNHAIINTTIDCLLDSSGNVNNLKENHTKNEDYLIYPNPVNEILTLSFNVNAKNTSAFYELYNLYGVKVKRRSIEGIIIGLNKVEINFPQDCELQNLTNGVYFLVLDVNGEKNTKKIILDR